jgi:oxygen-independent coproporphyrinogen-3 oxidase
MFERWSTDINIETSPNETTGEKLAVLKEFATNRISIGIQSLVNTELKTLQRAHSAESARRALDCLKTYDFPCLNLDLIYGIPGQTIATLGESLKEALGFEPDELFIYPLYIREGTGLDGKVINQDTLAMYRFARDHLTAAGYFQISMRRFTKKVPERSGSCGFENMLAIGCGGRSYLGDLHFCSPYAVGREHCLSIIDRFIKATDKTAITHGFILDEEEAKRRFVIKNLLFYRGLSLIDYRERFRSELLADFPLIDRLLTLLYAVNTDGFIRLTPLGLSLSDHIGPMFISPAVEAKMAEWKRS